MTKMAAAFAGVGALLGSWTATGPGVAAASAQSWGDRGGVSIAIGGGRGYGRDYGYGRNYGYGYRHRRGPSAGEVLLGAAAVAGVVGVIAAANRDRDRDRGYDYGYGGGNYGYGGGDGSRADASTCAFAAERALGGRARARVFDVDRDGPRTRVRGEVRGGELDPRYGDGRYGDDRYEGGYGDGRYEGGYGDDDRTRFTCVADRGRVVTLRLNDRDVAYRD